MIHDRCHYILYALGMIRAERRHVNRIIPAGHSCDHPFGIRFAHHPERSQAKHEGLWRHAYGYWFVGVEHVDELSYAHVQSFVHGLRIL